MDEEANLIRQYKENERLGEILLNRFRNKLTDDKTSPGDAPQDLSDIIESFLSTDAQCRGIDEENRMLVERLKAVRVGKRFEAFKEIQPDGALVYSAYSSHGGEYGPRKTLRMYIPELETDIRVADVNTPPFRTDDAAVPLIVHNGELLFATPGRMQIDKFGVSGKPERVFYEDRSDRGISALGEHQGKLYAASLDKVFLVEGDMLVPTFKTRGSDFVRGLASNGIQFVALTEKGNIVDLTENGEIISGNKIYDHVAGWDAELYGWENYGDIVNLETGKRFNAGEGYQWVDALVPMQRGLAYVQARSTEGDPAENDRVMNVGVYNAMSGAQIASGLDSKVTSAVAVPQDITQKLLGS